MISITGSEGFHLRKRCSGFTLIELVLVTFIIAIMMGISTPMFSKSFSNLQLREATYSIVKFTTLARAKAVSERMRTRVNFNFDTGKYWMTVNKDPGSAGQFASVKGKMGRFFKVSSRIKMEGTDTTLDFFPNGRSEDFSLLITDGKGKTRTIEIKGLTGEAEVTKETE